MADKDAKPPTDSPHREDGARDLCALYPGELERREA
jgi:hypothetical protein